MRHHHSTRSSVHTHRATAALAERHHAISPGTLGAVERFVSRLEHLFGRTLLQAFGDANADRNRHTRRTGAGPALASLLVILRPTVRITQLNVVGCNGLTDDFQVRHALFERL